MRDGELRTVRVEVLGAPDGGLEIPEVSARSSGGSRWPHVLGVLILFGLGAILFGLRPEGEQAADGTQREAPPTTIANAPVPAEPSGQIDAADEQSLSNFDETPSQQSGVDSVVLSLADLGAPIATTVSDLEAVRSVESSIHLIERERGFLALARSASLAEPDGRVGPISWRPVDATRRSNVSSIDLPRFWSRGLVQLGGQMMVLADRWESGDIARTLVSEEGLDWFAWDSSFAPGDDQEALLLLDGVMVTVERGRETVDGGTCSVFRAIDLDTGTITGLGQNVEPGLSGIPTWELSIDAKYEVLRSGGFTFHHRGGEGNEGCGDSPEGSALSQPAVVVLQPAADGGDGSASGTELLFPLPISATSVEVLGETRTFEDRVPYLIIVLDGQLWSVNMIWGEWTQLAVGDAVTGSEGGGVGAGEYALSETGDRIYQFSETGIVVFDQLVSTDLRLSGTRRSFPLESSDPFSFPEVGAVVYADDDLMLLSDFVGRLWAIDLPAPLEFEPEGFDQDLGGPDVGGPDFGGQDFGGVGLAR